MRACLVVLMFVAWTSVATAAPASAPASQPQAASQPLRPTWSALTAKLGFLLDGVRRSPRTATHACEQLRTLMEGVETRLGERFEAHTVAAAKALFPKMHNPPLDEAAMTMLKCAQDTARENAAARRSAANHEQIRPLLEAVARENAARAQREAEQRAVAERQQQERERCARDPQCVLQGVADEICSLRSDIADVKRRIARERSYARRTGVVNLSELQDAKDELRTWEEKLVENLRAYRQLARKPFAGRCPK